MEKQNAKHAFTIEKELDNSLKLLKNEKIKIKLRAVVYKVFYCLPAITVLTNKRIIFLCHRPIGADYLLYVNLKEIKSVRGIDNGFAINIEQENGEIKFAITSLSGLQRFVLGIRNKFASKKETKKFCKLLLNAIGG